MFKLGNNFKALHKAIPLSADGHIPIDAEDLIWRFASKLEFGVQTEKVGNSACKLLKAMNRSWMDTGRRPSGLCGACLIVAARMHNFRRTVREVVYIVKVTEATINLRLEEFKVTPSSGLTVEEFKNDDLPTLAHDPPAYYRQTEEYKNSKKKRKRKGLLQLGEDEDGGTTAEAASQSEAATNAATPVPEAIMRALNQVVVVYPKDSEGKVIPPKPLPRDSLGRPIRPSPPPTQIPIDPQLLDYEGEVDSALDQLANEHAADPNRPRDDDDGDSTGSEDEADLKDIDNDDAASTTSEQGDVNDDADDMTPEPSLASGPQKRKRGRPKANDISGPITFNDAWTADEDRLEAQISQIISDPNTTEHASAFATASQRAALHSLAYYHLSASRPVISMEREIADDEFADDPEVQGCLLSETERAIKETIWVNENKDWLRQQQQKAFKAELEKRNPPKQRRNRVKRPRIGEGQKGVGESPAQAALETSRFRSFSKKINYEAIKNMFEEVGGTSGEGSVVGSEG